MVLVDNKTGLHQLPTERFSNHIKSLQKLANETIVLNLNSTIVERKQLFGKQINVLKPSIPYLHPIYVESILKLLLENPQKTYIDELLLPFTDSSKCGIWKLFIRNQQMTFEILKTFLHNQPTLHDLELSSCVVTDNNPRVKLNSLCTKELQSFHLDRVRTPNSDTNCCSVEAMHHLSMTTNPNLKVLRLINTECAYLMLIDKNDPPLLQTLEISQFYHRTSPSSFKAMIQTLQSFPENSDLNAAWLQRNPANELLQLYRISSLKATLTSLILHNTIVSKSQLQEIFQLKKLQHLDLSMSSTASRNDDLKFRPKVCIHEIVAELPKLTSLDISFTNIGDAKFTRNSTSSFYDRDFWSVFENRKLDYLGLLGCYGADDPGIHLIANEVSGSYSISQLMSALKRKSNCLFDLNYITRQLHHHQYDSTAENNIQIIEILIDAVHRFPYDESILGNLCTTIYGMMHSDSFIFNSFQKRFTF